MLRVARPSGPEGTMPFRRQHITAEERVALGCACVLFAGRYGLITDLARTHGVSRRFLYRLRERARAAGAPAPRGGRAAGGGPAGGGAGGAGAAPGGARLGAVDPGLPGGGPA